MWSEERLQQIPNLPFSVRRKDGRRKTREREDCFVGRRKGGWEGEACVDVESMVLES